MIRESQSWTSSELIYLFVDGEADDVQKSLLFTALANDAGLQAEFSDAIRINAAVQDEQLEGTPPPHVTAALFEKAGFGIAAGENSSSVAGAVVESTGTSGIAGHLRNIFVPILSAFVGGMIVLFLAPNILHRSDNNAGRTVASVASPIQEGRGEFGNNASNRGEEASSIAARSLANEGKNAAAAIKLHSLAGNESVSGNGRIRSHRMENVTPEEAALHNEIPHLDPGSDKGDGMMPNADPASTPIAPELREVDRAAQPIPATEQDELAAMIAMEEMNRHSSAASSSLAAGPVTAFEVHRPRFALQVRGIAEIESFPNRSLMSGKQTAFENLAITGFYNLSSHHAIGIEVGREYHPLYVPTTTPDDTIALNAIMADPGSPGIGIGINSAGAGSGGTKVIDLSSENQPGASTTTTGYRLEPNIMWAGVSYQFRANPIDRLGMIVPFLQTTVGGTSVGPVGKATLGLSWKPDSRVSFGVGLEGTALLYKNNGEWYSSRKLGLTYGAQVSF